MLEFLVSQLLFNIRRNLKKPVSWDVFLHTTGEDYYRDINTSALGGYLPSRHKTTINQT
jgi:hypothetical protein